MTLPQFVDQLAPIGFLPSGAPVWPVFGAEKDDDDSIDPTGDGSGDDDDDDSDGDEDDDDEYTPPTEEEWKRTQAALTRANGEAKKHRLKAKELAKNSATGSGDKAREAAEEAEKKFKPVAIRSAAKAAFLEAGATELSGDQLKKLLRLVDMDEVDVDDDGDVVGLDDQVETIKADFPQLFGGQQKQQQRKRAPHIGAAGRTGGGSQKTLSTGERIAAQVLGR